MSDVDLPPADLPQYHCPACGQLVAPSSSDQRLLQCPACGEQFFAAANESSEQVTHDDDAGSRAELVKTREQELNELRIKRVANLRRGAYRMQSWYIIGIAACLVGAAELLIMAVKDVRRGWWIVPAGYCLAAAGAVAASVRLMRKLARLRREIRESRLPEPTAAPDFSTLSDGSQLWKGLEDSPHQ